MISAGVPSNQPRVVSEAKIVERSRSIENRLLTIADDYGPIEFGGEAAAPIYASKDYLKVSRD
jgi:hypothetical protein